MFEVANAFYFYFRISIYFYNFYSLLVLFVSLFVCCNFVILGKLFIDWSKNKLQRAAMGRGRRQRHNLCFVFYLLFILNCMQNCIFFFIIYF